jgi:hypothetical protein
VTIWIGQIQWMVGHGFGRDNPILRPLDHIETRDALLDLTDPAHPREAMWPAAEFIVGNPPFLGDKLMLAGLSPGYVSALRHTFAGRVPGGADLCCYWHEKARAQIANATTRRAGLLATQGIRGPANRRVLERIKETGDIFFARADDPWVLSGASVHISFVGQDDGSDPERTLDGQPVADINPDLTSGTDLTRARRLQENQHLAFVVDQKGGPFEIDGNTAHALLQQPNPDGRTNRDVVRPWFNGLDIGGRPREMWIIDFGEATPLGEAALYEAPFERVKAVVRPRRLAPGADPHSASTWWLHQRPRPDFRAALKSSPRYIATIRHSKHRLFVWLTADVVPDSALIVFARDDYFTFGVLHSRVHERWALATGTQLETRPRYTPTTTFETFPFPRPTDGQCEAIGAAARELVRLRDGWLNPPDLGESELAKRTLTNLYNQRPTWLTNAHAALDGAVLAAYGWPADLPNEEILARLLAVNLEREPVPRKGTPR